LEFPGSFWEVSVKMGINLEQGNIGGTVLKIFYQRLQDFLPANGSTPRTEIMGTIGKLESNDWKLWEFSTHEFKLAP